MPSSASAVACSRRMSILRNRCAHGSARILAVLVAAALAACGGDRAPSLPPDVGVIEAVIDGDTVDIEIGGRKERVRLIGIDTPELHTAAGATECMAGDAHAF